MPAYEIPLVASPQTLNISLAGVTYGLRVTYCDTVPGSFPALVPPGWILDINDALGNPIIAGLKLVVGVDLLDAFPHLDLGGSLIALVDGNPNGPIPFAGLGTTSHLYFVTPG